MPEQDPLTQLRGIHLPDPVSFWPPAPGWWLLASIILALVCFVCLKCFRCIQRNRYRRLALAQLALLEANPADPSELVRGLNKLLKQTAMAAKPATPIAGLSGADWIAFLDQSGNTTAFSNGAGNVLIHGPYTKQHETIDPKALQHLAKQWIKHHKITRSFP